MSSDLLFPAAGRVAAIDYGRKRIGVAICDAQRIIASPLCMHQPTGDATAEATFFRTLVAEETIGGFVVGLPVHADGSDSRMSVEVERFGAWLKETTGCPVVFHDERYSSQEAVGLMAGLGMSRRQKKARTDSLAAQIVLCSWLESQVSAGASQRPGALDG